MFWCKSYMIAKTILILDNGPYNLLVILLILSKCQIGKTHMYIQLYINLYLFTFHSFIYLSIISGYIH